MSLVVRIGKKTYEMQSVEQAIHFLLSNVSEEYRMHAEGD